MNEEHTQGNPEKRGNMRPEESPEDISRRLIEGDANFEDLESEFSVLIPTTDDPILINQIVRGAIISCVKKTAEDPDNIRQSGFTPYTQDYTWQNIHTHPDTKLHARYIASLLQRIYFLNKQRHDQVSPVVFANMMDKVGSWATEYIFNITTGSTKGISDIYENMDEGFLDRLDIHNNFDCNLKVWYGIVAGIEERAEDIDIMERSRKKFAALLETGEIEVSFFVNRFGEFADTNLSDREIVELFEKMLKFDIEYRAKHFEAESSTFGIDEEEARRNWLNNMYIGMQSCAEAEAYYAGQNNPVHPKYRRWIDLLSKHFHYYPEDPETK